MTHQAIENVRVRVAEDVPFAIAEEGEGGPYCFHKGFSSGDLLPWWVAALPPRRRKERRKTRLYLAHPRMPHRLAVGTVLKRDGAWWTIQ